MKLILKNDTCYVKHPDNFIVEINNSILDKLNLLAIKKRITMLYKNYGQINITVDNKYQVIYTKNGYIELGVKNSIEECKKLIEDFHNNEQIHNNRYEN